MSLLANTVFVKGELTSIDCNPQSVVVGDLNGDGKLDLAVANGESGVSVLIGRGDGTFRHAVTYSTSGRTNALTVADLKGDGKLDLVAAIGSTGVGVLFGNGDGTFQAPIIYATGGNAESAAVADFNADGNADLVVADG